MICVIKNVIIVRRLNVLYYEYGMLVQSQLNRHWNWGHSLQRQPRGFIAIWCNVTSKAYFRSAHVILFKVNHRGIPFLVSIHLLNLFCYDTVPAHLFKNLLVDWCLCHHLHILLKIWNHLLRTSLYILFEY